MTSKSLSVATALSLLSLVAAPVTRAVAATDGATLRDGVSPATTLAATAAADTRARLLFWNRAAIDASGLDHTRPGPDDDWTFGQQLGPGRASRAIAIVHIAMFEAVNAIAGGYESYAGLPAAKNNASLDAAIAFAAHDALVAVFPSQRARIDALLAQDFAHMTTRGHMLAEGIQVGRSAAAAVLAMRQGDGSEIPEPLVDSEWPTSNAAGHWRQDPISKIPLALGAHWGEVTPFVLTSADQFRVPPPPAMTSDAYTAAYNEVLQYGGIAPTVRTEEQTQIAIYWAYDGTPSLCAPPRLYNQITTHIADLRGTDTVGLARLLALVNTAMADAGIAIWESKYYYDFWRPITGIRESEPGTGPTGSGDGNPDTAGDPAYVPLCAPASNSTGPNFTPPFPSYPSGHAGFGGALFETLRLFYGTDAIPFTFVSDEFNGVTKDNGGNIRPLLPRSFSTLSQAEEENGQSRIYLGIHWAFDKTAGIAQGRQIADWVFAHAFTPKSRKPGK
jgi:hypothetical protein